MLPSSGSLLEQGNTILEFKLIRVVNALFFLLGDSPAYAIYVPTFRNTLFRNVGTENSAAGESLKTKNTTKA